MFKNWFTRQEDKNVWEILDYYVPAEKYREQCERLATENQLYILTLIH